LVIKIDAPFPDLVPESPNKQRLSPAFVSGFVEKTAVF
jgi:hypothetical protein